MAIQDARALNDERDAWVEAIMEQLRSEPRQEICLAAIDRWYHHELKKINTAANPGVITIYGIAASAGDGR